MSKFRKKPVVIEAFQFRDTSHKNMAMPQWFLDAVEAKQAFDLSDHLIIKTLVGDHRANIGDWIIRGVKGEIYPCKPDIFDETYELVE